MLTWLSKFNRHGEVTFGNLAMIMILLGVAAVIGVVMSIMISDLRADQTQSGTAFNVSSSGLSFFENLSDQWTLLGTVIGLVLVISVIFAMFKFGRSGGGI